MRRLLWCGLLAIACTGEDEAASDDSGQPGIQGVDADGDGYDSLASGGDDCDDTDPDVNPGAEERCDGVNNDCDGGVDESDAVDAGTWYKDVDGDGYPDQSSSITACERPPGYHEAGEWDCDDSTASAHPGAEEICNDGVDNNCNGDESECRLAGTRSLDEADALLLGEAAGDRAGAALASVGDVDGDGAPDLLVGAPGSNAGGTDSGAAWLVRGPLSGTASLSTAQARFIGGSASHMAGAAVGGAGDLDGDGYADLLVGAWSANGGGNDSGEAYVLYGPLSGDTDLGGVSARLVGELSYDYAGWQVGVLGAQIAVGAYGYGDDSVQQRGAVYLVSGPLSVATDLSTATGKLVGESRYDRVGWSLASGDVDGDGVDDLVSGAPTWPANDGQGAALLLYGPISGEVQAADADATLTGEDDDHQAGCAVAVGDVDGDGRADVVVGAWQASLGEDEQGAAYVVSGAPSGAVSLANAQAVLTGEVGRDQAGVAVSAADLDGDGRADVLIGAPGSDAVERDAGGAWLFYGPVSGSASLTSAQLVLTGGVANAQAGLVVDVAGDLIGDGLGALVVAAAQDDTVGADAGVIYVFGGQGW